jgi:zona occludens toxin (predicted ATPase)
MMVIVFYVLFVLSLGGSGYLIYNLFGFLQRQDATPEMSQLMAFSLLAPALLLIVTSLLFLAIGAVLSRLDRIVANTARS